jgi:Tfp pilus assembly protein PilX
MLLLAQTTQPTTMSLADWIIPLIPWVVVFGIVAVVFRRVIGRQNRITAEHIERMRLHMLAVEAKLDRLIEQGERRSGGA